MFKQKSIALTLVLAAVLAVGVSGIAQANADNDKRIKIDITVHAVGERGPAGPTGAQGPPGVAGQNGSDSTVPGPIGPQGPPGATGNVTVNVCQVGTSNCVAEDIGPNNTLTIFVNATGQVVSGNITNSTG